MNTTKILIAMSGGVDSAVVASLLKEKGHNVIGCFLKMHEWTDKDAPDQAIQDTINVCNSIGIELIIKDVSTNFSFIVIENFYQEYLAGRTPNPCVLCNRFLKIKELIDVADDNNITTIATGHYTKKVFFSDNKRFSLSKSVATSKDQTYMLWRLPQEYLRRIIFPLEDFYSKETVREYAEQKKLPVFFKKDSQDICFIPDGDYRKFIRY